MEYHVNLFSFVCSGAGHGSCNSICVLLLRYMYKLVFGGEIHIHLGACMYNHLFFNQKPFVHCGFCTDCLLSPCTLCLMREISFFIEARKTITGREAKPAAPGNCVFFTPSLSNAFQTNQNNTYVTPNLVGIFSQFCRCQSWCWNRFLVCWMA